MFGVGHVGRQAAIGLAGGGAPVPPPTPTLDYAFLGPTMPAGWVFARPSGNAFYFDVGGGGFVVGAGTPRFDADPLTLQPKGLLLEDSRQQALFWSFDHSNAVWALAGITAAAPTRTTGVAGGVDGGASATRLVFPAVSGVGDRSVMTQNFTATAAIWAISVWLKGNVGGETPYISITPDGVTFQRLQVTLTTQWQRFWFPTTALTAAAWAFQIGTDRRDASQAASSAMNILVWGPQAEAGNFPSSIISSGAAATSRLQETCSIPHTIAGYPVTYCVDAMIPYQNNVILGIHCVDDGTANNRLITRVPSAANTVSSAMVAGGSTTANLSQGNMTPGTIFKTAMRFGAADASYSINGAAAVTGAGTPPASGLITTMRIGIAQVGSQVEFGYIRRVRYWNTGLTDAQLQAVTT